MIVTELPFDAATAMKSEAEQLDLARSPGLHLSTIYNDIQQEWERRQPMDERDLARYRAGGFLWEHAFSRAFSQALTSDGVTRPAELWCDGVIGSPDLIAWNRGGVIYDTKFTWKSAGKLNAMERHFWPWLVQAKGYLKMAREMRLTRGTATELYVFFVNGDYAPPIPQIRRLGLEFSPAEIEENWAMIQKRAKMRGWL